MIESAAAPPLRFGVLGPLRAWQGESVVDLGPVQQRVVLAVLLLQAGHPIGRPQLISAIWGDAPPAHAVNLVQRHVSGLRRALGLGRSGAGSPCRLAWVDAGYVLSVPSGTVDLEIFESELGQARAARAAGNLRETAAALHSALAIWRGPLCDGLSSPFLDAQRDRLAESRTSLTEDRLELDLQLGGHGDLIAELRGLVTEHPLRERLRGLLMLALYRAGRQADALAAFRDARRCLNDELGVEPAAGLQELHQRILAADPQLAPPVPAQAVLTGGAGVAHPALAPAQLPHSIPDFTDRDAEIAALNALLPGHGPGGDGPVVIATIAGTAGVGKSALAVHWGHLVRGHFPDGQLYADLRGFDPAGPAMEPAVAVRAFLDAFAVAPDRIPVDLDAQGALYRSILAGRRVLIILDNARDGSQVRPLLPGTPGCFVVVTSRSQLIDLAAADGAHSVPLDLLPPEEARRLITRRLGPDQVAAERGAVDQIIGACVGLPLALSVVISRAAANRRLPLAGLAEELRATHGGLDALDAGDTRTDVRAVFSWSYQALSRPAAHLFRLLGLHTGPDIGAPAAASLAGERTSRTRARLAELTRASLLTERSYGRFVIHDLLHAYAGELAAAHDPAPDRRAAIHRLLDHYLYTACRADELLHPHREDAIALAPAVGVNPQQLSSHGEAMAWLETEYQVLLAALRQAAAEGFDVHAWQLAWALGSFFDRRALWHDAAAYQRAALEAAVRLGDPHGQAASHGCLAYAYIRLNRLEDARAHLVAALRLYEQLGDNTGQAHAHRSLAWVFDGLGGYQVALAHVQRAFELFRAGGLRTGQAKALNGVGWFSVQLGDPAEGLTHCQRALALQRTIEDQLGQADTLDSIAVAYHRLGRYPEAAAHYREALDLYRDFGNRSDEAQTWVSLGDTYLAAGDSGSAGTAWGNALAIFDELGHPDAAKIGARFEALRAPGKMIVTGQSRHLWRS